MKRVIFAVTFLASNGLLYATDAQHAPALQSSDTAAILQAAWRLASDGHGGRRTLWLWIPATSDTGDFVPRLSYASRSGEQIPPEPSWSFARNGVRSWGPGIVGVAHARGTWSGSEYGGKAGGMLSAPDRFCTVIRCAAPSLCANLSYGVGWVIAQRSSRRGY